MLTKTIARPLGRDSGAYCYAGRTGIVAAGLAANSELFQFRWNNSQNYALIKRIRVAASVSTTYFAAGVPVELALVRASAWSAAGTGGTAIAPVALLKAQSTMPNSRLTAGDARIATTGALGAGTKTLETAPMGLAMAYGPSAAPNGTIMQLTELFGAPIDAGAHPLVLAPAASAATAEGFVITAIVPATGTWALAVNVEWAEVDDPARIL